MTEHNIDQEIMQALADEDAEVYARFAEEPSMLAMGLEVLNSRNRLMTVMVVIVMTAEQNPAPVGGIGSLLGRLPWLLLPPRCRRC